MIALRAGTSFPSTSKAFASVRLCTGITGCRRRFSITKRWVTLDGLEPHLVRIRVAAREQRVRLRGDPLEEVRVGHQLVEREAHGAADIVPGDQRCDEGELEIRFRQELRVGVMQGHEVVDEVPALALALGRRVAGADLRVGREYRAVRPAHGGRTRRDLRK